MMKGVERARILHQGGVRTPPVMPVIPRHFPRMIVTFGMCK